MNLFLEICDDYQKAVPSHIRQGILWGAILGVAIGVVIALTT